jgi:uncharacterized membrane protein
MVGLVLARLADAWLARRNGGSPPPIESLVVIDAPVDRVWAELSDIDRQPRWMREMTSVRRLTDGPTDVGTRAEATVSILGIRVNDPVEVTEFTPPRRFAIRHDGTFSGSGVMTLEPGADGSTTIVRWDETLIAPVLPQVWAVLAAPELRRIFGEDLRHLRDLVEDSPTTDRPDPA